VLIHSQPVWVNPTHQVKTAVVLMQGYKVDALPVMEADQVVGVVTARQALGVHEDVPVSEVMSTDVLLLNAEMPIREAAAKLVERGVDVAFVVNDTLAGMVRAIDLLPVVSRSYDPLTRLPWQDALREWSIDKLRTGHEISIIFFDIDRFGQFNKNYDHVTGDRVLEQVARTIERELDPQLTTLCRYGGDEFAVATLYMIDEAQQLAARIARRVEEIQLPRVRETISVSYGVFGGRRTREREDVHYAATVDNLLLRASRLCMQHTPP
jgi:IMP dehydrogenase